MKTDCGMKIWRLKKKNDSELPAGNLERPIRRFKTKTPTRQAFTRVANKSTFEPRRSKVPWVPCTDARCKRVSPLWRLTMLLWVSASECYILFVRVVLGFRLFLRSFCSAGGRTWCTHTCSMRPYQPHASESRLLAVNTSTAAAAPSEEMGLQV